VFLASVLGVIALSVGLIEGIAEATAMIAKVFSGMLSDVLGSRKPLAALGYGLVALTKRVFALGASVDWVMAARFLDQVGNGIAQERAQQAARQAAAISEKRYRAGLVSYLEVVDTQRVALQAERVVTQILGQRLETSVLLIKAVGGGWEEQQI